MTLIPIQACPDAALYLYALLAERPEEACISHRRMPSVAEHLAFVRSMPYIAWYLVMADAVVVGAVYLSKRREIGVSIFREHRRRGYGEAAVDGIRRLHPGPALANIAPGNEPSHRLFERLGFKSIQVTYASS